MGVSTMEWLLARQARAVRRTLRAYLARPDLCGSAHDDQMYQMARGLAHTALGLRPDLAPGEPRRY
jgi:hypothetical protein